MDITFTIRGRNINLQFEQHVVRITANDELTGLLSFQTEAVTDELVTDIKTAYRKLFNLDFDVSDASFAVEIWGHVYADQFADTVKFLSPVQWIDNIAEKVSYRCEVIDIGEPGYDDNRFVWDRLASLKSLIARFLPQTG